MRRVFSVFCGSAAVILLASTSALADKPPATTTALSFTPSATVAQFSPATAVIKVTLGANAPSGPAVSSGTVKLYQTKTQGVPGSCESQNGNAEVQPPLSATPDANGNVTFDLNAAGLTSVIGTFGFIAKFSDPGNYDGSSSACLNMTVTPAVIEPEGCPVGQNATIAAVFTTSPGFPLPGTYTWNLAIRLHACKDLSQVSAQGGNNAWTGASFAPPAGTSIGLRKATGGKNDVNIWNIGSMAAGQTLELGVTVTGTIKPKTSCGTVLGLLGSWSALSTSQEFGSQKSDYTGTSTVTVGPDPCTVP
jgi:hypothetical protein